MADVTVSVDDVESGGLPDICAKTGAPSDGVLHLRAGVVPDARAGVGWLLALAGPLGWIALMPVGPNRHRTNAPTVAVQIPLSHKVYERMILVRRIQVGALIVFGTGSLALAVTLGLSAMNTMDSAADLAASLGLVSATAAVIAAVFGRSFDRNRVHVTLDATHRWLTLWDVHPGFVSAVRFPPPAREAAHMSRESTEPT